ncbi:MAG: GDSL-type esterase/lipase family protein, partial [Acidobacteria bacterium]|nr:GDSL-type esterase/lipase family protein [Acidobacteriota bacterium]
KGLAVLLMFGLTLAAAEIIARVAFPGYSDDSQYAQLLFMRLMNSGVVVENRGGDPQRFLGYTPNAVHTFSSPEYRYTMRTNSLGFRSKELTPPRSGEYRVWLLGDSMLVGVGSEEQERIDVRLEELGRLGAGGDIPSLSVFNFSVGGFNTAQELGLLRQFIREVDPDEVVIGFFVANDFLPNATAKVDEAGKYEVDPESAEALKKEIGTQHPYLFLPSVVWRILALNLYAPRLRYALASKPEVMDRSFGLLRQIQEDCQKQGAALLVVVIYPWDAVRGGWVAAWSRSRTVGQEVVRFCNRQGIEVLDLLSVMSGSDAARRFYYRKDGHLRPEGNRAVAEALYREILASHLRPAAHTGGP